jgi:propanediol dehydratase large subunit
LTGTVTAYRWKRFDVWDERPLRLDKFSREDAENDFCAKKRPFDPRASLLVKNGRVVEMDGVKEANFDIIDHLWRDIISI